jgi:Protein of unknown function (DUF3175)
LRRWIDDDEEGAAQDNGKDAFSEQESRRATTERGKLGAAGPADLGRMDLPIGVFNQSPRAIAGGLRESARRSRRTKGTKFQSAMSMLNLYINRAGRGLPRARRARLEAAKDELRKLFGRTPKAA